MGKPGKGELGQPREQLFQLNEGPSSQRAGDEQVVHSVPSCCSDLIPLTWVSESCPSFIKAKESVTGLEDPSRAVCQHQEVV